MKVSKNLKLNLPEPNDTVRVLENITDNFEKIDEIYIIVPSQKLVALVDKYKGIGDV